MVKRGGFLEKVRGLFLIGSSQSQEEYFRLQLQLIGLAKERIVIYGYDAPFMDRVETVQTLADAAKRVDISAIIPRSHGHVPLEQIAENNGNIEILRTDEELSHGYMVYGKICSSLWNSMRKTSYIPEIKDGVIYRVSLINFPFGNFLNERYFDEARAKIEDKVLV